MALFFVTDNPAALLESFKDKINQEEKKGSIETWEESGNGFGHKAPQWKDAAIFHYRIWKSGKKTALAFYLKASPGRNPPDSVDYAKYHGMLLQTFITHLCNEFTHAQFIDRRKNKK